VKAVRVLSRDTGLAIRLRHLLNGSIDLATGGSLFQARGRYRGSRPEAPSSARP